MSRKTYTYGTLPNDTDLRRSRQSHSSSGHRLNSVDLDYHGAGSVRLQDSLSPSSSSTRDASTWSQDNTLHILSSCGLEPSDLSLLAKLPENVLTVETLPHLLKEIKGKRGAVSPSAPSLYSSSHPSSSSQSHPATPAFQPAANSSNSDWDHQHSGQAWYPPVTSTFSSDVEDSWGTWGDPSSSNRVNPTYSSSSGYTVDYQHRSGPCEFGKVDRAGPEKSANIYRSAGSSYVSRQVSTYRSPSPPKEFHPSRRRRHPETDTSSSRSRWSSSTHFAATAAPTTSTPIPITAKSVAAFPSRKEAMDFHGTVPQVFPYSCSLCDMTVLSEKNWNGHINGGVHADRQLQLLQRFPKWDCRLESVTSADNQSQKATDGGRPIKPLQTNKSGQNKQPSDKVSEKGKVVCVKFPAQSVDEAYLSKLTEPFGKIIKILMFPSLAFVELSSNNQAKDLVKHHVNHPLTVNGQPVEFSISNTFTFLQSSNVVSFVPSPSGDGKSDLINIVKRFGTPSYTLFLPSRAFVEMKNASEAQKLVDYYSSNTLRINNDVIKVSFSEEYKTLTKTASAKKYEEEVVPSKRPRTSSEREEKSESRRKRSRDRSPSTDRSRSWRDTGSRNTSRNTRCRSKEKSSPRRESNTSRRSRSKSDDCSRNVRDRRSRSRSPFSKSTGEKVEPSKVKTAEFQPNTDAGAASTKETNPETTEKQNQDQNNQEDEETSEEGSDIEGMAVIGEDGENLGYEVDEEEEDEDLAVHEQEERDRAKQPAEEELKDEQNNSSTEINGVKNSPAKQEIEHLEEKHSSEKSSTCKEENVQKEEKSTSETMETRSQQDNEVDRDFPWNLENCITLDELEEEQSETVKDMDGEPEVGHTNERTSPEKHSSSIKTSEKESGTPKSKSTKRHPKESGSGTTTEKDSGSLTTAERVLNPKEDQTKESSSKLSLDGNDWSCSDAQEDELLPRKLIEKESNNKAYTTESSEMKCKSPNEESQNQKMPNKNSFKENEAAKQAAEKEVLPTLSPDEENLTKKETDEKKEETEKKCHSKKEQKQETDHNTKGGEKNGNQDQQINKKPDVDGLCHSKHVNKIEEGITTEPEKPTKPVGTKFVRPVVGYFCSLCQVIYADEDEAKLQHCSSLTHYRKYQEATGVDPWTNPD